MTMTPLEMLATIGAVALGTMITRFLPFVVFSKGNPPAFISYLGRVLPPAAIGLLVVYCLKNAVFTSYYALPELVAIALVVILHKWRGSMFLSIGGGTAFYMFLVQVVFR